MNESYWTNRYLDNTAAWDIGGISAPLKEYIDTFKIKDARILIPGCGNAYEAEYLLQQGFSSITLIDISPVPVENIRKKLAPFIGKQLTVICDDFFSLEQQFDLVLEQTFLSALEPSLRKEYAEKMSSVLVAGGKLSGVIFNKEFEGGPPFGGTEMEYRELFSSYFHIKKMELCYNSISPREGNELFIELVKK